MELLDGTTLQEAIAVDGAQPEGRVVRTLAMACAALPEAHGTGLIHRDIKPANIMFTRTKHLVAPLRAAPIWDRSWKRPCSPASKRTPTVALKAPPRSSAHWRLAQCCPGPWQMRRLGGPGTVRALRPMRHNPPRPGRRPWRWTLPGGLRRHRIYPPLAPGGPLPAARCRRVAPAVSATPVGGAAPVREAGWLVVARSSWNKHRRTTSNIPTFRVLAVATLPCQRFVA